MRMRCPRQWVWLLPGLLGLTTGFNGCAQIAELLKGVQKAEDEAALADERKDTQTQLSKLKADDAADRKAGVVALRGKRTQITFADLAPVVMRALVPLLRDPDPDVARETVQALAVFANVQEQDPEEREIDPEQRQRLIRLKQASEEGLAGIPALLQSPDPETRWWAARALYNMLVLRPQDLEGEVDPTPSIAPLIGALTDESLSVRVMAADTLLGLKAAQAAEALIAVVQQDQAPEMRRLAAWALGELGAAGAAPALLQAVQNPEEDAGVRWRAARSLGLLRAPEAVAVLLAVLDDAPDAVRSWSIWALSLIGTPQAQERLARLNAQEAQLAQTAIEEKALEEKRRRAFLRGR